MGAATFLVWPPFGVSTGFASSAPLKRHDPAFRTSFPTIVSYHPTHTFVRSKKLQSARKAGIDTWDTIQGGPT
jgi:hypothetical protein